jgi:hypothetical protein
MGSIELKSFQINYTDWAEILEKELDEYMTSLQNWFVYNEEDGEEPEVLSGEVYCGCNTCYWREVLFFVSPRIMIAQNENKIELTPNS